MKKVKKIINTTIIAIAAFVLSFGMFTSSIYATVVEDKTVNREFEFSGLVSKKAIQNFDYGSKDEVFVTQREGKNTYLSRCIISSDGKAYLKDYIILKNYEKLDSKYKAIIPLKNVYIPTQIENAY